MNYRTETLEGKSLIVPASLLALVILSMTIALFPDMAAIILFFAIWTLILSFFLMKFAAEERKFLIPYLIAGIFLRLVLALFFKFSYADTGGLITPDEFYYFDYAKDIADTWKSGVFLSLNEIYNLVGIENYGYHIYDALHFLILKEKLLPVISNIFLDIFTSLIIFRFTYENFNSKIAKAAFLLIIFNPYLIYWSTFNLKDTMLTFLITLFIYTVGKAGKKIQYAILTVLLLIFIATLRFYLSFILVIIETTGLIIGKYRFTYKLAIGAAMIVSICILYLYTPLDTVFKKVDSLGVEQTLDSYSSTSFSIAQVSADSNRHIRGYDPKSMSIAVFHALFSPSPLNWNEHGKYFVPGTLLWYLIFPYYVLGTLIFLKSGKLRSDYILLWLFPLAVLSVMVVMPAINEHRHRVVALPYMTVLAVIGIYSKYRYKQIIVLSAVLLILGVVISREFIE